MTDTIDVEDRLRRTYRAIADGVPELPVDPPWLDATPLDLEGYRPEPRGQRWVWAAAVAAGLLVIVGVVTAFDRSGSPPLEMLPAVTEPPEPSTTVGPPASVVDEGVDDHHVSLTLELPHVGELDTGRVDVWRWDPDGYGCRVRDDGTGVCPTDQPGTPGWRPMYAHVLATSSTSARTGGDGHTWSLVTFRVPPAAASILSEHQDQLAVTASIAPPTCVPFTPGCAERQPPPFSLPSVAAPTAELPAPGPRPIIVQRGHVDGLGGEALFPGTLDVDAAGCVTLGGLLVLWPDGTQVQGTGAGWDVLLPSGARRSLGDEISIGGGAISLDHARQIATIPLSEASTTDQVIDAWSLEDVTTVDEIGR